MFNPNTVTSYHQALVNDDATQALEAQGTFGNFVQYGITSSIASGLVSFYNTGKALGNVFGAEFEATDTKDVLQQLGLEKTANYYDNNRETADFVGFALGALVPGLGGVKAAQAMKAGLQTYNGSSRAVLGLKNTLYPKDVVARYTQRLKVEGSYPEATHTYVIDAAKQGFREQAVETLFAEAAILASMNQSGAMSPTPTMTKGELDYFGAIANNLDSAGVGFVFGTGIGGVIATVQGTKALRGLVQKSLADVNKAAPSLVASADQAIGERLAGDSLFMLASERDAAATAADQITQGTVVVETPEFAVRKLKERAAQTERVAGTWFEELVKPDPSLPARLQEDADHLVETLGKMWKNNDADGVRDIFGGLVRASTVGEESLLMDVRLSPLAIVQRGEEFEQFTANWVEKGLKMDPKSPEGLAFIAKEVADSVTFHGATRPDTVWGKDSGEWWSVAFDDENRTFMQKLFTARHEIGHNQTDRIAKLFGTKFGSQIRDEAVSLSRQMRPALWAEADEAQALLSRVTADNIGEFDPAQLAWAERRVAYANRPQELLADAWAAFEGRAKGARQDSLLYNIFAQNNAARAMYGKSEVVVDTRTGRTTAVSERVPTARDLGTVTSKAIRGKGIQVTHAQGTTMWNFASEWDVSKLSYVDASSQYHAAMKYSGFLPKTLEVPATNLPTMLMLINRAKAGTLDSKVTIKTADDVTRTLDFSTPSSLESNLRVLRQEQIRAKAKLLEQIRNGELGTKTGKYGTNEVMRMLDLGDEMSEVLPVLARDSEGMESLLRQEAVEGVSFSEAYPVDKPTMMRLTYASPRRSEADLDALADVERRIQMNRKLNSTAVDAFFASELKQTPQLPQSPFIATNFKQVGTQDVTDVTQVGGLLTASNGNYVDFLSFAQEAGAQNLRLKQQLFQRNAELMEASVGAVRNSPEALAEYAALDSFLRTGHYLELPTSPAQFNQTLMTKLAEGAASKEAQRSKSLADRYARAQKFVQEEVAPVIDGRAQDAAALLISRDLEQALQELVERPTNALMSKISDMMQSSFRPVKNQQLADMFRAAQPIRERYAHGSTVLAQMDGRSTTLDSRVWYPGKLDTARYKELAFVVPKKGAGLWASNNKMIVGAPNSEAFHVKMQQVRDKFGDDVRIVTPNEVAEYKRLRDEYDSDLAFTDYDMVSTMHKKGVAADIAPEPTPQMLDHFLNDINNQTRYLVDGMFQHKYGAEFEALERAHRTTTYKSGETVRNQKSLDSAASTPYSKLMDTMLNKGNKDFKVLRNMQQKIDNTFSAVWNVVSSSVSQSLGLKKPIDFAKVNDYLEQYGFAPVYNESVKDYLVRTEKVNDQVLAGLVPKLNFAASTLMLRWDYVQPIVNALSVPILSHPELRHIHDQLPELQRMQLERSLTVKVHGTEVLDEAGNVVQEAAREPATTKLLFQATKDWFNKDLRMEYEQRGLLGNIAKEMREATDLVQFNPRDFADPTKVGTNIEKFISKSSNWLAKPADTSEEFSKFVTARMAHLYLDSAGVVDRDLQQLAMKTFQSRVIGNYNASQRPGLFQGALGQMVGLFQTYQFNLIQQMLRNVGESPARAAGMMGIQAGIFGVQSVPGFHYLNAHIAEKSDYRNDFYTGINDALGDTVGEWIVYGAGSNFVRPAFGDGIELYTRGDLNPRTPILIPTSLDEAPVISMASRLYSSMATAASNVANGAPTSTALLQAVSTFGVNRPLQGIAQVLQGERLTSSGVMLASTEDLNFAQVAMRALGAKGLDESIAVNAMYRAQKFESARQERINAIGSAARTMIRSGQFDAGVYRDFMERYTTEGGKHSDFASWMHRNGVAANESQIGELARSNDGVVGRYLQSIMGGMPEKYVGSWQSAPSPTAGYLGGSAAQVGSNAVGLQSPFAQ